MIDPGLGDPNLAPSRTQSVDNQAENQSVLEKVRGMDCRLIILPLLICCLFLRIFGGLSVFWLYTWLALVGPR